MALVNLIKQASMGAFESSNPVAVLFGTVVKANPLEVNVEQRFTLTRDFLVLTERLTEYKTTIAGQEVVIRKGLQAGDKVILLRVQGGQQYIVWDRVV